MSKAKDKRIYIRDREGNITEFINYQEFLDFATKFDFIVFSHNFVACSDRTEYTRIMTDSIRYVVLDTSYVPIHRKKLLEDILEYKRVYYKRRRDYFHTRFIAPHRPVFRKDPIPRLSNCNHGTVRPHYRHPKIQPERILWFKILEEQREYRKYGLSIKLRLKRSLKNLPEAYDDVYNADNRIRSWKRTKKKRQYLHPERC